MFILKNGLIIVVNTELVIYYQMVEQEFFLMMQLKLY